MDVEIIDIDEQPELAKQYGITSVPTFIVYVCGKKAVRTQGHQRGGLPDALWV